MDMHSPGARDRFGSVKYSFAPRVCQKPVAKVLLPFRIIIKLLSNR
jgi:hypothetical protein